MKTLVESQVKDSSRDGHFVIRMIIMAISAAIFAYSLTMFVLNLDTETLDYRENGNVSYNVCLKPNDYFSDECQPSGKQYVASLIKSIDARFSYVFNSEKDVDLAYDYNIVSRLIATDTGADEKTLYDNEEILMPTKTISPATNRLIKIEEDISLNYIKYNNLMTSFRADYGLNMKANLIVTMNIKITGRHNDFRQPIESTQKITLNIPLSERTISMSLDTENLNNHGQIESQVHSFKDNLLYIVLAAIGAGIFIITLIISIIIIWRRRAGLSEYEKELHRILKEYNQLIVDVDHIPEADRPNIVQVKNFNEMLDARDTIQKPILRLEISDDRNMFVIEDDNGLAYVYILSAETRQGRKTRSRTK